MNRAKILAHHVGPDGQELLSYQITFPRVVLAEIVTHRVCYETIEASYTERTADRDISKNSASSRAIPFDRMIKKVMDEPYMPMWTLQQKGMQGANIYDQRIIDKANERWLMARDGMIDDAAALYFIGVHKQDCNRLLEPWQHVTQIVTSARWDNYFALRCHEKAFPPFRDLARRMYLLKRHSIPKPLDYGEWHLPFTDEKLFWQPEPLRTYTLEELPFPLKSSIAKCCWISYENHEKDASVAAVLKTCDSLAGSDGPIHSSPFEHQATPMTKQVEGLFKRLRSNLTGWMQARKLLLGEETLKFDPSQEEIASWNLE